MILTAALVVGGSIFAISSKYEPGATLNPSCQPGETNCTVKKGKFVDGTNTNDAVYTAGNVGIGTTSPDEKLTVNGSVKADSFIYNSDRRLKKNIKKLENYRDILKIDAVRFDWKKDGKHDVGIIAQEVQKYFPEFVKKSGSYLAVDYPKLAVPMLNLLQEQEKRLDKQEKEIKELKEMIKKLQK